MPQHKRSKTISVADERELFAIAQDVIDANRRHDAMYGMRHEKFGWRSQYVPASPRLDRVSIWDHHRRIEEALFQRIGMSVL